MAWAAPVYRNRIYKRQVTGGSTSIRASWDYLRQVGASAREMLKEAAAAWGVPVGELIAENGFISHDATGRRSSYGKLAESAATMTPPAEITLKKPKDWKITGKPTRRLDTPAKVDGSAVFGIDVKTDGMLVGTVRSAPMLGGKLKDLDPEPALTVKGVRQVVPLEDAVVVVADGYWPAMKGAERLNPVGETGPNAKINSDALRAELEGGSAEAGATARDDGDVTGAIAGAKKRIEATYHVPFLADATMEPMNATARVSKEGVEIWAPTQNQGRTQRVVAKVAGVEPEQVRVHTTFLGGGFGRRLEVDYIVQAVQASKAVGAPVRVVWSREEDVRRDFYRPMSVARFRAGLDNSGIPQAWHIKIVCPSIFSRYLPDRIKDGVDSASVEGIVDTPYGIPNQRVEYVMKNTGVPVGFWRSVGHSQNAFFMEMRSPMPVVTIRSSFACPCWPASRGIVRSSSGRLPQRDGENPRMVGASWGSHCTNHSARSSPKSPK
jgi:isoquinoline 1-oxidoreductase subunit beta